MHSRRLQGLLVFALALCAQPASAFLDPPYITPANPAVSDNIFVNVYGGQCDLLNIGVVPPVVTKQGNAITILFTGTHEGDPEFCIYGIGTTTYPVDSYPAGSYTLEVDRRYLSFSAVWIQETLGIIPFTVSGVPTQPIETPTLSSAGFASLFLVLIIAERLAFLSHRV